MYITTIEGLRRYLKDNSGFSQTTIDNVVSALGFSLNGDEE
jgi:DNA-binding phage protein